MECELLICAILVFCSHSVVSSIDKNYGHGQYQPELSLVPRKLLHSNSQNVNYQPSTNPPRNIKEVQQEQWFSGPILPQQQQHIRPQLINTPSQKYYQEVPLQVSYSQSTPTHSSSQPNIHRFARPQDILDTQQKQDLPSATRPRETNVLVQQHSTSQLGNNQQIEEWWSGQKLQPQSGVIGQAINPNAVNAYPETYVHHGSYEYRYPQYQMAAQIIPNTINNYNSYGQRWPHQNQYLHSNLPVSSSESYPQWSGPSNQYLAPRDPQIGVPYSGYTIPSHQQYYPIATEVSENGLNPQLVNLGQLGESKPGKPEQSEQPGKPVQSTQTGEPGQSEQPGKSGQPRKQEQSAQLEKPGQSWQPVKSAQPKKSEKIEQSGKPSQYQQPKKQGQYPQPGKPGQSAQPGKQGQTAIFEKPGQTAQPGKPDQSSQTGKPDQSSQTGKPGQSAQPGKPGNSTQYRKPGQYINTAKPILTNESDQPGYQDSHAQIVPVAQPQTVKLKKHYIIVNTNGTFEYVDNFDFKNVPIYALAIIEVQDKIGDTNIEKPEQPVDTGINIIPQDTDWDTKEQNGSKTGHNYKNLVAARTGPHDSLYNIHPTTEDIVNNYFKPEYLMPIQSNNTNSMDTNTTLPTFVIKENVESSTDTSYLKLTTISLANPNPADIDLSSLVSNINDNIDSELKHSTIRTDHVIKSKQTTVKPLTKIDHNVSAFNKSNTKQENNTTHFATAHAIDNNVKFSPINVETVTNRPSKGLPLVEIDTPISHGDEVMALEIVPSSSEETFIQTDGNNTSIWYGDDFMVKIIEEPESIPSNAFKVNIAEIEKNGPEAHPEVTYFSGKATTSPAYIETPEGHGSFKLRDDLEIDFEKLKTVVDKPVVWFRPDEKFWDKVTKGEHSYDSLSLYNVRCQPRVIEKQTTIHHYPNGTEVVDLVVSIWDSVNDLNPKEVITDKFVRNPGE